MINRFSTYTSGDYSMKYIPETITPDFSKLGDYLADIDKTKSKIFEAASSMKPKENPVDAAVGAGAKYQQSNKEYEDKITQAFKTDINGGMQMLESYRNKLVQDKTSGAFAMIEGNYEKYNEYLKNVEKNKDKYGTDELTLLERQKNEFLTTPDKYATNYDYSTGKYQAFVPELPTPNVNIDEQLSKVKIEPVTQEIMRSSLSGTVHINGGKDDPFSNYSTTTTVLSRRDIENSISNAMRTDTDIQDQLRKKLQALDYTLSKDPTRKTQIVTDKRENDLFEATVKLPELDNKTLLEVLSTADDNVMRQQGAQIRALINMKLGKNVLKETNAILEDYEKDIIEDLVQKYNRDLEFYNSNPSEQQILQKKIQDDYIQTQVTSRLKLDTKIDRVEDFVSREAYKRRYAQQDKLPTPGQVLPGYSTGQFGEQQQNKEASIAITTEAIAANYNELSKLLQTKGQKGEGINSEINRYINSFKQLPSNMTPQDQMKSLGLTGSQEDVQLYAAIRARIDLHDVKDELVADQISTTNRVYDSLGISDNPLRGTLQSLGIDYKIFAKAAMSLDNGNRLGGQAILKELRSSNLFSTGAFGTYDNNVNKVLKTLSPAELQNLADLYDNSRSQLSNDHVRFNSAKPEEYTRALGTSYETYTPMPNSQLDILSKNIASVLNNPSLSINAIVSNAPTGASPISSTELFNQLKGKASITNADIANGSIKYTVKFLDPTSSTPRMQVSLVRVIDDKDEVVIGHRIVYPIASEVGSSINDEFYKEMVTVVSNPKATPATKNYANKALALRLVPPDFSNEVAIMKKGDVKTISNNPDYTIVRYGNGWGLCYKNTTASKIFNNYTDVLVAALNHESTD